MYVSCESCKPSLYTESGSKAVDTLFSEYLACAGDWLTSTVVVRATSTSSRQLKGREIYIKYADLVAKHGEATASCIRAEKKRLQLTAEPDQPPFWFKHPEMPGREDCICIACEV